MGEDLKKEKRACVIKSPFLLHHYVCAHNVRSNFASLFVQMKRTRREAADASGGGPADALRRASTDMVQEEEHLSTEPYGPGIVNHSGTEEGHEPSNAASTQENSFTCHSTSTRTAIPNSLPVEDAQFLTSTSEKAPGGVFLEHSLQVRSKWTMILHV